MMSGSILATWPKRRFHGTRGSNEERPGACAEYSECPRRPEPEIEPDPERFGAARSFPVHSAERNLYTHSGFKDCIMKYTSPSSSSPNDMV